MPPAKVETRRRYKDPRTYQEARARSRALARAGLKDTGKEPAYDDVKVVVLTAPDGTKVRVYEDQVAEYEDVWARNKAAADEKAQAGKVKP